MDDAGAITQVHERESAKVSAPMDPAAESNVLSDVLQTKCAGEVCTMGCREVVCGHPVGSRSAWLP